MNNFYTDTEWAFLCDYFGIARPQELACLDTHAKAKGVYLHKGDYSHKVELPNAVARLALGRIQDRLPCWGAAYPDGKVVLARDYNSPSGRPVELLPTFLFTINWADSGPGFSWPEAYYITWLPGFDRYVVTASQDSPDAYGVEDLAIGWSEPGKPVIDIAHDIIVSYWKKEHGYREEGWEGLFGFGLVQGGQAWDWREKAWPAQKDEYDEEEGEDDEVAEAGGWKGSVSANPAGFVGGHHA